MMSISPMKFEAIQQALCGADDEVQERVLNAPNSNAMSTPTAATYVYHPHIQDFGSTLDSDGHDDGESMMIETVDAAQQLVSEKMNRRLPVVHRNESIALGP